MQKQLKELLDYYGKDDRLLVVYEELAELTQAITKYERGLTKFNTNIVEETAHVLIMIEYLKIIYGFDDLDIKGEINKKLTKLIKYRELYPRS